MYFSKKDVLLDQLAACHNDPSWFPPFAEAVQGLTAEQAAWRKDDSSHSIWQLVVHLTYWNKKWLNYFVGKETFVTVGDNNDSTFQFEAAVNKENWISTVHALDAAYLACREVIAGYPESKLDEMVQGYPGECPWWGAVSNLCTHNAYHIGQIVYIRKQQGWV
ncbi:hypothetical protein SD70_01990 [Gordoniibacillus kamchatkensis]|uniref:DinB-like domain-containing protein n=1 Tax=Gordoniibacillus kamchatkensis TaxID=1590651 RepID=A0ABR5AN59_9BACL|nr:DinB family protein [Paenibacillus sp. VKM B-2647]KIL42308.1 hypothetical protein SD70_01990 [Paenibacillus sp. VKM B-2647]